jgi:hypothetical protein
MNFYHFRGNPAGSQFQMNEMKSGFLSWLFVLHFSD